MIEGRNISKSFGDRPVLLNVSVSLVKGQTNLIIGQSGMGKTVLLKCLVGLLEADQGQVFYDGREFSKMSFNEMKEIRQEIGMLFQGGALFDSLNVEENVMFPLTMFTEQTLPQKLERANFPGAGLEKFDQWQGKYWREVYRDGDTAIYEVND